MTIDQAFNATIEYYDSWMKAALPNFHDLFQAGVDVLTFDSQAEISVLDLGAGTGLFSQQVAQKYPHAHFDLYDVADQMLNVARLRFQGSPHKIHTIVGDYRELDTSRRYDLVISSLSIHHLSDEEKRMLFRKIYAVLNKPGMFVNIDQVLGETEYLRQLYWNHWLEQVHSSGQPEERIHDSIQRRQTYDRESLLSDQLAWMKAAGLDNVDCVYKNFFVAVLFGTKA